jgi:hypothetical protein
VRLYFICGSGKVIQISSTSFSAKNMIDSIWVLIKATLCKPVSTAVLAPRQKTSSFNIDSYEILFGYRSASPTEYSPFPQPAPTLMDCHFEEFCIPLAFLKEINHLLPSLVG